MNIGCYFTKNLQNIQVDLQQLYIICIVDVEYCQLL